jgi:hypothetical protein
MQSASSAPASVGSAQRRVLTLANRFSRRRAPIGMSSDRSDIDPDLLPA